MFMGRGNSPHFWSIMADKENYDELIKSNGKYHIAFDKILEDKDLDVEAKTFVGTIADRIFSDMKRINSYLEPFFR